MTGSLIIGDYDVLAPGGALKLAWDGGRDLGDPIPDVQTVARVLLDGDVVSGVRSANRQIVLKLLIKRTAVVAAAKIRADVFRTVNQSQWTMQWVPDTGMDAVLFDCFRGQMERTWEETYDGALDVLVLTIPALPFTRDAVATMLTPPAVAPTPTVLDSMEPGGPTTPAYMAETARLSPVPQYGSRFTVAMPVSALTTDFPQSTAVADTGQYAAGTQSRKITQQVITVGQWQGGAWQETTYAPLTTAGVLAAPVDLSAAGSVSWQARADSGSSGSGSGVVLVDPTTVGVATDARDDSSLSASIGNGTWALTLTDSSGRSATWLTQGRPSASWGVVSADLTLPPGWTQAGFDLSAVAQYRLRLYRINTPLAMVDGGSTAELYPSDTAGGAAVNMTGCQGGGDAPEGTLYYTNAYVPVTATSGSTLAKWSHPVHVPVTAGQTYSASCGIYATGPNSSAASFSYTCGIEWLNSGGTVLSETLGTVAAAVTYPTYSTTDGSSGTLVLAEPVAENLTAPANAVAARLRFKVDGSATQLNDQFAAAAPRIVPGATAYRYRYTDGIIERSFSGNGGSLPASPGITATSLWVDQLLANPATAGITLTKSYGYTLLPAVGGVARCPMSLAVSAKAATNWLLLARTPNPPPRFVPILDAPSSAGDAADATALRGAYQRSAATYTLPSSAYNGTYAVLGRIRPQGAGVTAKLTIADSNLSTVLSIPVAGTVNVWQWAVFGAITLPPTATAPQNSSDTFTITFSVNVGTDLDILVLVDISGEMLIIDGAKLSDGTAPTEFWLDSPDSDEFTGTAWAGGTADRSDAVSAGKWQSGQAVFNFEPVHPNMITVVADGGTGATLPQVALTYARRWAGEAVPDGAM